MQNHEVHHRGSALPNEGRRFFEVICKIWLTCVRLPALSTPSALFQNIDVILPKLLDGAVESIESSRLGGRPYKTRCSGSSVLSVGVCMRVVRVPVHDTHTNKDWFRWNGYSSWICSINIPDKAILSCNAGWNTSISCCNPVFLRLIYFIDFVWFTNALSPSLPFS